MKEETILGFNRAKQDNKILVNVTLLGICFTLFTFLVAFNPELLRINIFLTLQLVCAIPLFMASALGRSKATYSLGRTRWANFGFVTYLLAYAFLINVVGIFLISFVSTLAGITFFIINILSALAYSAIALSYDLSELKERIFKDLAFILILVLLGVLPAINFY